MSWARVSLLNGRSSGDLWEADPSSAGVRIDVGASPECVWQVVAHGVRAFHLEMYWDGQVLWVAPLEGAEVRIDGQLADDWYATVHGSTVELGQAKLRVETSHVPLMAGGDRMLQHLDESTTAPNRKDADAATRVEGQPSVLDPEATRMLGEATQPHGPSAQSDLDRIPFPAPPKDELQTLREPGGQTRAVFGGAAAAQDPQATRLVQTPNARRPAASGVPIHKRPPPPRIGNKGQAAVKHVYDDGPDTEPEARRDGSKRDDGPPPKLVEVAKPTVITPSPLPAPPPPPAPPAKIAPVPPVPAVSAERPKFAAPPPVDVVPDARARKPKTTREWSLPPRTWALLVVTVLALAFVILMEDAPQEDQAPPVAAVAPPAATPAQPSAEATTAADEPTTAQVLEEGDASALAARAVDAIMAGRHAEARELYEQLAEARPSERAYAEIARILRRRLDP